MTAVSGVALLLAGVALKAELLGVLDVLDVRGDRLWVALPGFLRLFPDGIAIDDLTGVARRLVVPVAGLSLIGAAAGAAKLRGPATVVAARWPRGLQGVVAAGLLGAALLAFLPVPLGMTEGVQATLIFVGFALTAVGLGGSTFERVAGTAAGLRDRLATRYPRLTSPWAAAGAMVLLSAVLTQLLFRGTPHVWDSVSHVFQARMIATGHLFVDSHPLREFFHGNTIVNNGRWYSQYPPGHTIMLAFGVLLHAPWLVNPLLGGAFVLALAALGRECLDGAAGRLPLLLVLVSPFVVLMSTEFYSHATALLLVTLALHAYVKFMRGGDGRWIVAAGAFLGMCAITRPLTAVGVALPIAVDAILHVPSWRAWPRLRAVLLGAVACGAVTGTILVYNTATGGSPLAFGYSAARGPGFGVARVPGGASTQGTESRGVDSAAARERREAERGAEAAHPIRWWLRVAGRIQRLNESLLALPFPSLLLVVLAFTGPPPGRWSYFLLSVPAGLLIAHAPVLYWETEFGPRYAYEASGPLLLLSAVGLRQLPLVLRRFAGGEAGRATTRARGLVLAGFAVGLLMLWPTRLAFYASDNWLWALQDDAARAVDAADLQGALVFVADDPLRGDRPYLAVFLRNGIDLEAADVVYARDLGPRNPELMEHFPDRVPYRFEGGELTLLER